MRQVPRTAIVTGASSGIGAALARRLAADGVRVGLTARRETELEAVAEAIRGAGGSAVVAPADAADRAATLDAFGRLAEALGPIDLLVANAGMGGSVTARGFSAEAFERVVRVNLLGPACAIEAVLPGMLDRGRGHIVGLSSVMAYRGFPGSAGYGATKAGLSTLLEGLRIELRRAGVRVTTVHPGLVRTPMTSWARPDRPFELTADQAARIIVRGIHAGRSEINFPWPTAAAMGLVRLMPNWLYDRAAERVLRGSRDGR